MDDSSQQSHVATIAGRLRLLLIGLLSLLGILVVVAQVGLQWLVAGQQQDVQIISLASRQATLSQQIAKTANRLLVVGSGDGRRAVEEELRAVLVPFRQTHAGLQHGDANLQLPGGNSLTIVRLFSALESDYQGIIYAADQVLALAERPGEFHQAVQKLNQYEAGFLPQMDTVISAFKTEAQQRESTQRWVAALITLAILALLFVATRLLILPLLSRLKRDMQHIEQTGKELDKLFLANPIGQLIVDPASFAVIRANGRAAILFGAGTEELNDRPLVSLFDGRLNINRDFLVRVRNGEVFDAQAVMLVDAQQHAIPAFASVRPIAYGNQRRYLISLADRLGND